MLYSGCGFSRRTLQVNDPCHPVIATTCCPCCAIIQEKRQMACELPGAGAHVSSQHSISHFSSFVPLFFPLSSQILLATLAVDVMTKIVLCRKRNTDYVHPVVSKSGITMRQITFMGGFNAGEEFAWFTAKAAMVTGVSHDHAPSLLMAMIPYICHLIR